MKNRIPEPEIMLEPNQVNDFDLFSRKYLAKYGYHFVIDNLIDLSFNGGKVIDFGTGSGWLSIELHKRVSNADIVGVDLSSEMLKRVHENLNGVGIDSNKVSFQIGDVKKLPFHNDSVDAVISFASMHHWSCSPHLVFLEALRLVKNGGKVVIGDLKRSEKSLLFLSEIPSKVMQQLFLSSVKAAYTSDEVRLMLDKHELLSDWKIVENAMCFAVIGSVKK